MEVAEKVKKKERVSEEQLLQLAINSPNGIIRELNNRSLLHFLQWAWPAYSAQPFVVNWHIKELCKQLEEIAYRVGARKPKKHDLLINISPGTTKTALCSIMFPVWCWTKWPWMRFITCSYSSTLSLESAEFSRDIIKSDLFKQVYPEYGIKSDKDTKGNFRIVTYANNVSNNPKKKQREIAGGNRYSTSVGGTLTGFHADIIIWDDPLNPTQAASDKELENANRWLDQTLPTRKTSKENTTIIGIMQRLAQNDPSGHWLDKKKKNLRWMCLPGEARNYADNVRPKRLLKKYKRGLFDKYRMPQHVLDELLEDLGQYGYAGQIGQSPAPPGGGMFKVDMFVEFSQVIDPSTIVKSVRYWDKAATINAGAYSVGVLMHHLKNGFWLIENVKRGRWSSEVRESIIKKTAAVDGTKVHIVIEQEPGSGGKESAQATVRNLAGFIVRVDKPGQGDGNKAERADPFSVQVNSNNILLKTADWNALFKEELSLFPNSTFKDQVDASSGAFNYLSRKKRVRRIT